MKKLIILSILLAVLCGWTIARAGEREELQLQRAVLQEKLGRLMAEFELAKRDMQTIEIRLNDIMKAEQIKQEEGKKNIPKQEQGQNPAKKEEVK
jgi:hypothetical protein